MPNWLNCHLGQKCCWTCAETAESSPVTTGTDGGSCFSATSPGRAKPICGDARRPVSVSVTPGDAFAGRYRPGGVSCATWRRYVTPIRLRRPKFDMFALCMSRGANKQIQDTTPTTNSKSLFLSIIPIAASLVAVQPISNPHISFFPLKKTLPFSYHFNCENIHTRIDFRTTFSHRLPSKTGINNFRIFLIFHPPIKTYK